MNLKLFTDITDFSDNESYNFDTIFEDDIYLTPIKKRKLITSCTENIILIHKNKKLERSKSLNIENTKLKPKILYM